MSASNPVSLLSFNLTGRHREMKKIQRTMLYSRSLRLSQLYSRFYKPSFAVPSLSKPSFAVPPLSNFIYHFTFLRLSLLYPCAFLRFSVLYRSSLRLSLLCRPFLSLYLLYHLSKTFFAVQSLFKTIFVIELLSLRPSLLYPRSLRVFLLYRSSLIFVVTHPLSKSVFAISQLSEIFLAVALAVLAVWPLPKIFVAAPPKNVETQILRSFSFYRAIAQYFWKMRFNAVFHKDWFPIPCCLRMYELKLSVLGTAPLAFFRPTTKYMGTVFPFDFYLPFKYLLRGEELPLAYKMLRVKTIVNLIKQ